MSNRFDDEHKEAIQNLQEEIDNLKRNLDEFHIRKRNRINYLPTETIQKHAERIKSLNDLIRSLTSQQRSSKWGASRVAGGDSAGKVTYTYPTGNSEDY